MTLPRAVDAQAARVSEIFSSAVELAGGERQAFLATACGGDEAMHAELCALITAHENAGAFMRDDEVLSPDLEAQWARLKPEGEGDRIGRYKLLQEIGEGGFGTVWMAEQMEPVSRRVALKIIKLGMDTREVIARFESERQALAMMDHPNIAQVFDAGATPLGRPFFVMELVRGIPITEYCDEAKLGTRERLALFGDVCSAINHAHQKGVIHRDLKPSNVMITLHGEKAVAKVIDFGIAKATEGKLTEKTLFTRFEQFIGTPVYMSPEQASWSGLDVDTRSDIYSLGVLLYEMLTGKPPFDAQTMASAGPDEMRRMIREQEPVKPSARLRTTAGEERTRIAKARHIEPSKVNGLVEPDLDWIVMKAIDKDRARRYQTANALVQDIERFLADKTVSARPPTAAYQFRKFARRHKLALRVAAGIASVLLAATSISTWQAVRATKAEQRAKEQSGQADKQRIRADGEAELAQQNLFYAQMHLAQQAWREHRGLRQMLALLDRWPSKDGAPDRRGWEWFYLHSLPDQNLRTLTEPGPNEKPCTVAWHTPTNRLAEGTADGLIRIWDAAREQTTLTLKGPAPEVTFSGSRWLGWSPDGGQLAAGGKDGTVHVWETGTGRELLVLQGHKSAIKSVAFSSDGARVAAWAADGTIKIWGTETGRLIADVTHPGSVTAGAWSPDDKLLATGHADGTVTISGPHAGARIATLQTRRDTIYHLAWSPDSARLASTNANDFFVRIWDVALEKVVLGPLRHSHEVTAIAWEPDGRRLATGSIDETVKIWDATTGRETVTLRGHLEPVTSLAWGPAGRLASGGNDGSLRIWNSTQDQESNVLPGEVRTTSVSWSPDGKRLASAGDDGEIRIWDPAKTVVNTTIAAHDPAGIFPQLGLIRSLAWSPDGRRLASAGLDGKAAVWDAASGRKIITLPAIHGAMWSVAWSPDGKRLAAGSQDGMIHLIADLESAPQVHSFPAHQGDLDQQEKRAGVRSVAWNPAGTQLASGGFDRLVKIWDAASGAELAKVQGHPGRVIRVAWSPDGKQLASAAADYLVMTWNAATGENLKTMRGHKDFVDAVGWSPDGTRLASAGLDSSVRIWDPRTSEETLVLRGASGMFHDLSWNSDGAQLAAACSDGQVWIWDARPGFARDRAKPAAR